MSLRCVLVNLLFFFFCGGYSFMLLESLIFGAPGPIRRTLCTSASLTGTGHLPVQLGFWPLQLARVCWSDCIASLHAWKACSQGAFSKGVSECIILTQISPFCGPVEEAFGGSWRDAGFHKACAGQRLHPRQSGGRTV